ncbi:MAG: hypothetical protein V2A79_01925 [Planctomycetota bacterium]
MTGLALALLATALVAKIVERIRAIVPAIDGAWVNLLATAIGVGIAYAAGISVIGTITAYAWPWWLDQLITGVGLGAGASFFSDLAGRSGPRAKEGQ